MKSPFAGYALFSLLMFAAAPLAAQTIGSALTASITTREATLPPPPRIDAHGSERPVVLRAVDVRSEIVGGFARTRVEMLFANPNARVLEGELVFPLLAGQEVDGFALDIGGVLRDAVPVGKAKGKQVFEDTIRQRADPALLESAGGENFRLRVYPLPANGMRRVVVHYSEALDTRQAHYRYRLPLAYAKALATFTLDVNVSSAAPPIATAPAELGGAFALRQAGTQYRGTIRREDFSARGWLEIAIPQARSDASSPALVQRFGELHYLYADLPVAQKRHARRLPARIGIVWDSSASGSRRDHAAEFNLLDAYFRAMRNGEVRLTQVRDVADPVQVFEIRDGDWSALKRALQDTIYDGATDLAAWRAQADVGEYLLFSDGLANYGASLAAAALPMPPVRVFPVVAVVSANRALLRRIARSTPAYAAGAIIDLTHDAQAAADALLKAGSLVLAIDSAGDADILADADAWTRGRLRLHGVVRGTPPASVRVRMQDPDGSLRMLDVPLAIDASARDAGAVPIAARLWARARIDALEGDHVRNRAEIRRIGQSFAMVTRETSLIVLDDVADYVRHDILPPAPLRAEFDALRQTQVRRERDERLAQIERIARDYADKIAWWQRDFPKTAPAKIALDAQRRADRAGGVASRSESADARALRAPAPRPQAASPAAETSGMPSSVQEAAVGDSGMQAADLETDGAPALGIRLRKWTPDAPYIARLRDAPAADLYAVYLDERAEWRESSAFHLDAADLLFERGQAGLALRVLSNLAEMELENRQILRILGYRLLQAGQPQLAVPLFEQVRDLAPFEPQSFRDLGLAHAATGAVQKAADALYEVVVRQWDGRFAEVGLIALTELNALIATHAGIDRARYDDRLLRNLPVDLRVVLSWDADNSDINLWVTDPDGERAFYGNRLTRQGGRMSADLTAGYGPEEFMLKNAKPGRYRVEANYYGNRQQLVAGAVSLRLALTTGFGRAGAKEQSVILRLRDRSETVLVGEFEVGGPH